MRAEKPVVLITGSSGFIGSALRHAFETRYHVVGFDRPATPHPTEAGEHVPCDLTSDQSVQAALMRVHRDYGDRIASVIHLAAYYDFAGEPSPLYDALTVRGTERLLRGLGRFRVSQFVFSSTMLVHAPCKPGEHIDEDWPIEPRWEYPKSKVRTEHLIRHEHRAIPAVILRIAGVYDDRCRSIPLAHQIQRIFERRLTANVFPGDISTGQSFVHLNSLVEAFESVLRRQNSLPPLTSILIGEPDPMSYDELQRTFGWLIHHEAQWETKEIPKSIAELGSWVEGKIPGTEEPFIKPWMIGVADDHYALDISRARSLLKWEPRQSLRETLPKMVEALKTNPRAWYHDNKLKWSGKAQEASRATGTAIHSG